MLPLLAVATMLSSCLQEETAFQEFEYIDAVPEIPVEVDGFAGTRSVVNETSSGIEMLWGTSESIGVYGSNLTNAKFVGTNKYYEQASTSFKGGSLFSSPKYAYYPYREDNASNPMTEVRGEIPQIQYFSTVHKKMNTDYKIGVYASRTLTSYKFTFSHILTFLRFIVNADGTALQGDKIQQITLTVTDANGNPRQVIGKFTFDLTKSATEAITNWDAPENGSNKLTLVWSNTPELKAGTTHTAYLSSAPKVVAGDILNWEIRTDKHIATFTRTSKAAYKPNGLVKYTLTLANYTDMVVKDIPQNVPEEDPEEDDILAGLTNATPVLNSLKFTVENNPGKILSRKFTHNSSFTVTTSTVKEEVCAIDQANKKIQLNLPYLNNRKLVPTFEIPEGTALIYEGGVIENGVTEIDFAQYKQIAVINGNGEGVIYDIEFTNTGLPVVVINQATGVTSTESDSEYSKASAAWYKATGAKWQPKESDWEMTEGIDNFMIYNADGTPALADKNGAIVEAPVLASTRVRGNVTQQMPKKPFAVKLDKKHAITITNADGTKSVMPAHKRWVLLANWKDRTLMRNAVAFGIADVFQNTLSGGMEWNPSGQFVELVYNGVHVGTYYLCEQIKIDGNRLDINEPLDDEDNPYTGDPEVFGYLMESDDGYDEAWKFTTANYVPFLLKDDANADMLTYAQNFVRGIEDQLYNGSYSAAYEKMDLASFVDFWLIQELMMNSETSHPKSCYSYINNGKMYAGPLWDFDWNTLPVSSSYSENGYAFGESMLEDAVASTGWFSSYKCYHKKSGYPSAPDNEGDKTYLWYPMLVKDATFKALAAERWNAVKGAVQAYVDTQIPIMEAQIAASEAENNKMWPVDSGSSAWGSKRYSTYGIGGGFCGDEAKSFSDAVDAMQSTLNSRISGMSYVSDQNWPDVKFGTK